MRKKVNKGLIFFESNNESNFFERGGKTIPDMSMRGVIDGKCIFDYGNIRRKPITMPCYGSSKKSPIVMERITRLPLYYVQ
ncbi:MAG: hypothetical protein P0116_03040 [Candidatus Nitrosocosmicus sp.]|nr:hypothetical protein [Candidatus Nitrosocosmicus sp.]